MKIFILCTGIMTCGIAAYVIGFILGYKECKKNMVKVLSEPSCPYKIEGRKK